MTTLDELESADVPGVGQRDLTDVGTYVGMIGGVAALMASYGAGKFLFKTVKSTTGVDEVQNAVPEV